MRAKLCLSLVAFGQLCAVAMAQVQSSAVISQSNADSTIYVTHVTVIDTKTGKEAEGRTVVISGDRISEVKDSKGIKLPAGAKGTLTASPDPACMTNSRSWSNPA